MDISVIIQIFAATLAISLISFIGAITLVMSERRIKRILFLLVGFSAGALIGGAMLHILPEAIEHSAELGIETSTVFTATIAGFILFFILEKVMWRHCHEKECPIHTFAYLNLFGDGVHNFIDGLIIAASFVVDARLGIATTIAVAAHEIPQELGDFGVIVYGGIAPRRALMFNFLSALACVGGGIAGYAMRGGHSLQTWLLPIAAGGFLYIAASDLIPELHKERDRKKSALSFASFILGIAMMWLMRLLSHGH